MKKKNFKELETKDFDTNHIKTMKYDFHHHYHIIVTINY